MVICLLNNTIHLVINFVHRVLYVLYHCPHCIQTDAKDPIYGVVVKVKATSFSLLCQEINLRHTPPPLQVRTVQQHVL